MGAVPHLPPFRYVNAITSTKWPPDFLLWIMAVDRSAAVSKSMGLASWRVARRLLHTVGEPLRKQLNRVHMRQIRFRVFSGNHAYQICGYAGSGPLAVLLCDNGSSAAVGAELEANSYERPLCHHYHNLVPVRYAIGIVHVLYATRTASRRPRHGSPHLGS